MSSRSSRPPSRTNTQRPLRSPGARGRAAPPPRARRWIWPAAALGLLVVLVGGFLLFRATRSPSLDGVVTFSGANVERGHKAGPITYPQTPPVGGVHNEVWQNCGIYDKPVANENAVHSLEHGAVWITYRPDLPAAQVEQLRKLARGHGHMLVSPYPNLPAPIVASAWGVQLKIEGSSNPASDPRLPLFIQKYEQGVQTPEPGASCRNGTGNPIEQ